MFTMLCTLHFCLVLKHFHDFQVMVEILTSWWGGAPGRFGSEEGPDLTVPLSGVWRMDCGLTRGGSRSTEATDTLTQAGGRW